METKNAIIESAYLSVADHGQLSAWIYLDYGGSGQGFGGWSLYNPEFPHVPNYAGLWIWRTLEVAGVGKWENLKGRTIRVRGNLERIEAIGHIIKDLWFEPWVEFEALKSARGSK